MAEAQPGDRARDRRNFFRVRDRALLGWREVEERALAERPPESHFQEDAALNLTRELRAIDQENNSLLRQIGDQQREIELYLRALNRKIDLIGQALVGKPMDQGERKPQPVSLSEGGIAFLTRDLVAEDALLVMQLTLLPDHVTVYGYGRVASCEQGERQCRLSVNFLRLRDADRRLIARHIMQVQLAERRGRREDPIDD